MRNRNRGPLFSKKNLKNKFSKAGNDLIIYSIITLPSLISIHISFSFLHILFRFRTRVIGCPLLEKYPFTYSHMLAIRSGVKLPTAYLTLFKLHFLNLLLKLLCMSRLDKKILGKLLLKFMHWRDGLFVGYLWLKGADFLEGLFKGKFFSF